MAMQSCYVCGKPVYDAPHLNKDYGTVCAECEQRVTDEYKSKHPEKFEDERKDGK